MAVISSCQRIRRYRSSLGGCGIGQLVAMILPDNLFWRVGAIVGWSLVGGYLPQIKKMSRMAREK